MLDPRAIDMLGVRCNRLTVEAHAGSYIKPSRNSYLALWQCRCDCGNRIIATGYALRSGKVKSCGCARADENRRKSKARAGIPAQ